MKKYLVSVLAMAMTLSFAACNNDASEAEGASGEEIESSEKYITEEYCFVPKTAEEKKEAKELAKQKKLAKKWEARAENVLEFINLQVAKAFKPFKDADMSNLSISEQQDMQAKMKDAEQNLVKTYGSRFVEKVQKIEDGYNKECPDLPPSQELQQAIQMKAQLETMLGQMDSVANDTAVVAE